MSSFNLITVLGPTASGKTAFGARLAKEIGGEIISADSRQVYRGMDLGTGKDYQDYWVNGEKINVHLVDIHDAGYKYSVFEFQNDFLRAFKEIHEGGYLPVMVGGTGMYIEAILSHYKMIQTPVNPELREKLKDKSKEELADLLKRNNPELHNTSDLRIRSRTIRAIEIAEYLKDHSQDIPDLPLIKSLIFGIKYDRNSRRRRITERLKMRLQEGMIDEVKILLEKIPAQDLIYYGLEYKFITLHLIGELSYAELFKKLETAIHQFAKRQMTWFRKMERQGYTIHWLDGHMPVEEKIEKALSVIREKAPELLDNR